MKLDDVDGIDTGPTPEGAPRDSGYSIPDWNRSRRLDQRKQGLCGWIGCEAESDGYYCDAHRRHHNERMRGYRAAKRKVTDVGA